MPDPSLGLKDREGPVPRRWTLHALNTGWFVNLLWTLVSNAPRWLSYAGSYVSTGVAWMLMADTRAAVADNLRAVFPDDSERKRRRRALTTFRSYARDFIDFIYALTDPTGSAVSFDLSVDYAAVFRALLAEGRGVILVTGHHGNWEIGSVLMLRTLGLPMTVVAMAEASAEVNALRRRVRDSLGADTLEVRQSLDTALQIRRRLGENRIVAMLMDRHLGRDRVEVTLLGRPAWFLRTPAMMAYLTDAPLLPCFIERVGPGQFRGQAGTPIRVSKTIPREAAIRQAAQEFADQFGPRIKARPECWYHFYRYWAAQQDDYEGLS